MLAFPLDKLRQRAESLMSRLRECRIDCRVVNTNATVGGGSLPEEAFPSVGIEIRSLQKVDVLAQKLRAGEPPVIGIITEDTYRIDLRTVLAEQDERLVAAILRVQEI